MTNGLASPAAVAGARFVRNSGYDGCVELANDATRVVLERNVGGRVLSYALNGVEALYRDPAQDGARWDGKRNIRHPAGGRFDVGPEYGGIARDEVWFGPWTAEIIGPRSARLTSPTLPDSGLQVAREFTLDASSARLRCTQIIRNRGPHPLRAFHWGRTFAPGGGIAFAPLPASGRFPRGYALGGPPGVIDFLPAPEPNVRIRDGILEIVGAPSKAKFNFDVSHGWLAYLSPAGLLFVKTFAIHPDRTYGELAANNASIWYGSAENTPAWPSRDYPVEIEPIGPLETIAPGDACSFTENWWLEAVAFPGDCRADLQKVRAAVAAVTNKTPRAVGDIK